MQQENKKVRTFPVYVLDKEGNPLMPTRRFGWVRRGIESNRLVVVSREPFTVQLQYEPETKEIQEISLGIDFGEKHIGLSASTQKAELFASTAELRTDDIKSDMRERAGYRRNRRGRGPSRPKKKNFNRKEGWTTNSLQYIIEIHINLIEKLKKILPISKIVVEKCRFDFQKMLDPDIQKTDYQHGENEGWDNFRQYIIWRDKECQICHGKSQDKILQVHHIIYQSNNGTHIPSNLIALCKTCHDKVHANKIVLEIDKTAMPQLRAASLANSSSVIFIKHLRECEENVKETFGYITNYKRKILGLEKSHVNDAFVIAGNYSAKRLGVYYGYESFKRHERKLHEGEFRKNKERWHKRKNGTLKKINRKGKLKNKKYGLLEDGTFVPNQRRPLGHIKLINGFAAKDVVKFNERLYFVTGRRTSGAFELRDKVSGKKLPGTVNSKKLKLIQHSKPLMITSIQNK